MSPAARSRDARPKSARSRLLDRDVVAREIRKAQRRGEVVVFTNGCFDLLHIGHLRSLEQARGLGDRLVVAINSDASVRKLKGPDRPLVKAMQRAELIAGLACVDWVVIFSAATPRSLIKALRLDVLAKGGDWALHEIVGAREAVDSGGRVVRLRAVPGIRTTSLIDRLRN